MPLVHLGRLARACPRRRLALHWGRTWAGPPACVALARRSTAPLERKVSQQTKACPRAPPGGLHQPLANRLRLASRCSLDSIVCSALPFFRSCPWIQTAVISKSGSTREPCAQTAGNSLRRSRRDGRSGDLLVGHSPLLLAFRSATPACAACCVLLSLRLVCVSRGPCPRPPAPPPHRGRAESPRAGVPRPRRRDLLSGGASLSQLDSALYLDARRTPRPAARPPCRCPLSRRLTHPSSRLSSPRSPRTSRRRPRSCLVRRSPTTVRAPF